MKKDLLPIIIKYKTDLFFADRECQSEINEVFLSELSSWDISDIDKATNGLLTDRSGELACEDVKIKLECAGVYTVEPVLLELIKIRYLFLLPIDLDYFKTLIFNIMTCQGHFMDSFERKKALMSFVSDSKKYARIKSDFLKLFDMPIDSIDSLIAFVFIKDALGAGKDVSKMQRAVYTVIIEMASLQCDGLSFWLENRKKSEVKALIRALKLCGESEYAQMIECGNEQICESFDAMKFEEKAKEFLK